MWWLSFHLSPRGLLVVIARFRNQEFARHRNGFSPIVSRRNPAIRELRTNADQVPWKGLPLVVL